MTTRDRYLTNYRPGSYCRPINSLADFLEAVGAGEDVFNSSPDKTLTWSTYTGQGDYQALKALGWSAGSDYGSYGSELMMVYSPHK